VNATVLRTNFFGKSLVKNRVSLSDWVIDSLQRRAEISLFSDIYFSPLSMHTLSSMLEKVLEGPIAGVYNLGSHTGMSKSDFALEIAQVFGLPTATARITASASVNLKAPRPKDMRMDCGLFERTFSVRLPSLSDEILSLQNEYELST
jgi:dTDP-4-dehydrorhamnose reductase